MSTNKKASLLQFLKAGIFDMPASECRGNLSYQLVIQSQRSEFPRRGVSYTEPWEKRALSYQFLIQDGDDSRRGLL